MFTYTIIYEVNGTLHSWWVEAIRSETEALEKFDDYFSAYPGNRNPLYITRHSATVSKVYSVRRVDVPYQLSPAKVSSTVTPR